MPVSETVNRNAVGTAKFRIRRDSQGHFAGFRELDRVAKQIEQHLPQPCRVADQVGGHARRDLAHQGQPFFVGPGRHHLHHLLQMIVQREAGLFQFELRGFDLGEIEDVVDEIQQIVAGAAKDLHIFVLLRGKGGLREQVGDAHDRIHRRSDFMTHARQKIRFGPARALGGGLGLLQFRLHPLALGDIARRGEHALQRAVPVVKGGRVVGHDRLLAVARARRQLVVGDRLFAQHELDRRFGPLRIGEVALERRADQLVARAIR